MKNIKILVIAHYYPPINSSGAKRFQYTSQYWAKAGADVSVLSTTKKSSDGGFTETVPKGVRLYEMSPFGKILDSSYDGNDFVPLYSDKKSFIRNLKDIVMRLLGQIPDPRLPFAFSLFFKKLPFELECAIRDADYVVATSPPWSMLLAGVFLKKRFNKKLVLDYRDQFSYCHEMPGGWFAKKMEFFLDSWLVKQADFLVTISEPMKSYYSQFSKNVFVVTNGYDADSMDIAMVNACQVREGKNIIIRYMGIISDGRIPRSLIKALDRLKEFQFDKFKKIRIEFFGNSALLKKYLVENFPNLLEIFNFYDFVPYEKSLRLMVESDYLLFSETSDLSNLSTQGILTTKLFEYIGSGRPILADIHGKTLAGGLINKMSNENLVSNNELDFYSLISEDDFYVRKKTIVPLDILEYTRENQAYKYLEILKNF